MTWIHIPSLIVSADTVVSRWGSDSPSRSTTSGPSHISNGTSIASGCFKPGSTTNSSMTLRCGEEISEDSTDDPGVGSWISSLQAHRANHSPKPERWRENLIPRVGTSGPNVSDCAARYDPNSLFWRTCQASLFDLEMDGHHMAAQWSESWPKQGMIRSGELFLPAMLMRPISASGGGSWHIPTSTTADVYTGNLESSQQSDDSMHSVSLPDFVGRIPTPSTMDHIDRKHMRPSRAATNRKTGYLSEMIGMWSTPTSWEQQESIESWTERREREKDKGRNGNGFGIPLDMEVKMWATPTDRDSKQEDTFETWEARKDRKKESGSPGGLGQPLPVQVGQWTTPTGDDANNVTRDSGGFNNYLSREVEGSLSPDWEAWLMGIPIGWTKMEPMGREEYDQWLQMQRDGTWWKQWWGPWWVECPPVATEVPDRTNRLKCQGNGIVPASLSLFLRGG